MRGKQLKSHAPDSYSKIKSRPCDVKDTVHQDHHFQNQLWSVTLAFVI